MLIPVPGSPEELAAFAALQAQLPHVYERVSHDPRSEHLVVVVPSLSMDPRELEKITGAHHYEERLLFFLMLLRRPRTRVLFLTSQAINPTVVDYYLHLLSGVPTSHARKRLMLMDCSDAANEPLSGKVLTRPRMLKRIREIIARHETAHMVCFNSSKLERTLAVQLGIPLYANDPSLLDLGTKSGCRETFKEAGILFPDGFERLQSANEITEALATLKGRYPDMRRAVVKLNEGFSGEGNALFYFDDIDANSASDLESQIRNKLPTLKFEAAFETWESFESKYEDMGGIVEQFVEGEVKRSPSIQCRVNALGEAQPISTHDQVLGGPSGQVFMGCTFPADDVYRLVIQEAQLSPSAATIVGGLRMLGKAAIVGHPVFGAVAESTWSGVGASGVMWRSSDLQTEGVRWPDIIDADVLTDAPETHQDDTFSLDAVVGEATRPQLQEYDRVGVEPVPETSRQALQAALLVAYGTLDWFYPYFEVVGRDLDDALLRELDTLATLETVTRTDMRHGIGRLMHAIHDGHGYVYDWGGDDWPDGYMAVQLQQVDGEVVIRTSNHDGLYAGDVVVETDGVPVSEWFAEAETRYSASSDGYAFVMAADEFKEVNGRRTLTLRAPDGTEREEVVAPMDWDAQYSVPWGGTFRDNGWLSDLDAPNIYYVNLSDAVTPDESVVTDNWAEVETADGIVLDMRDYPSLDIYGFAGFFRTDMFTAPWFDHPTWTGPSHFEFFREIWDMFPSESPYTGPIALMVSPFSVSAAECFAQMLMDLPNVTVVGQQSASTNGTVTNLWLPGQFQIYFTGMRLLNLDGSQFHTIGVVPNVYVEPDPVDLAAGIDPELMAAIEVLRE